jgi:L-ascorbate metabolism protein UlaG (beta-lactamase superfamily)
MNRYFTRFLHAGMTASLILGGLNASAQDTHADATYLANEAVMVTSGESKILFDPLFVQGFNIYPLVPEKMRAKMMAGTAPFDGVDAVFVSHVHGDHFAAKDMVDYLKAHTDIRLFAPQQALAMLEEFTPKDGDVMNRVIPFELEAGGAPARFVFQTLTVEAVRIPHAGNRPNITNLSYRVTLDDHVTVMHFGDADPNENYFAPYEKYWAAQRTDHAFPPYWFFDSEAGQKILQSRINTKNVTGIHVPIKTPRELLDGSDDYFSKSGESRIIPFAPTAAPKKETP